MKKSEKLLKEMRNKCKHEWSHWVKNIFNLNEYCIKCGIEKPPTDEKEDHHAILSDDYDLLKISKKEKDRLPPEFHKLLHTIKKGIDKENTVKYSNYHCPVCHTTSENLLCSEVRLCEYNIPTCAWYKHEEYEHEAYDEKFYCINCGHQLNTSEVAELKV